MDSIEQYLHSNGISMTNWFHIHRIHPTLPRISSNSPNPNKKKEPKQKHSKKKSSSSQIQKQIKSVFPMKDTLSNFLFPFPFPIPGNNNNNNHHTQKDTENETNGLIEKKKKIEIEITCRIGPYIEETKNLNITKSPTLWKARRFCEIMKATRWS